ncbi:hypothetical protein IQ265_19390 [Nodosilinea sp. LEGE 06152]|uniref:hypothetical protein n=1 Tax=Nodosilinea sp. LEGE 06152 TaxID=2777966 RepID=UPI0018816F27|nr:hypothetical protein [Nodosilinea sp. LEGE 06152]MBE9158982.1 hypothetical protein [Nodosilinea sp. LEGE 06152]
MKQLTIAGLMLGTVLTAGVPAALAQAPDALVAAEAAPAAPALPELETTRYEDVFSIAFPAGWQVSAQPDAPQVVAESAGATGSLPAMRTEITWQEAPPQTVVGQSLEAIRAKGYTVSRYDAITIDSVTAVRLWLSEIPDGLPNAFVTYVGYPTATATITSYYDDTSANIDPVLTAIHQSFARANTPPAEDAAPIEN